MRFFLERTARAILSVWLALSIAFWVIRLIPGGPVRAIKQKVATQNPSWDQERIAEEARRRVEEAGFLIDEPTYIQYLDFMNSLLQGSMGQSIHYGEPVTKIVAQHVPWTIFTMTTATLLVFVIAVGWGALMAYNEGSKFDFASSTIGIGFAAFPFYVLGFALILVAGYWLDGFLYGIDQYVQNSFGFDIPFIIEDTIPVANRYGNLTTPVVKPISKPGATFWFLLEAVRYAILPIASVVISQAGIWALSMRGNSIQELGEDYVRVARLRGLPSNRIATRYVARNAILPLYTGFLTLIGYNLGASIVLEAVFDYQGMGWLMWQALIEWSDLPLVMGVFMVFAVALVLAVYVADLTYGFIDPRIRQGDANEAY